MKRRTYLASFSATSLLLSGCLERDASSAGLAKITIINKSSSGTTVEMNVRKNDKGIISNSFQLDKGEIIEIDRAGMGKPTPYEVSIETTKGQNQTINSKQIGSDTKSWDDETCIDVIFKIRENSISVFVRGVDCSRQTDN